MYYPRRFYFYRPPVYWWWNRPVVHGPQVVKQSLDVSVTATGGSNVNVNINQIIGGYNRPVPRFF